MEPSHTIRSVVITGASTGIGRACALRMDRLGWQVFAGIRTEKDAASLRKEASQHLTPLRLEVTDAASLKKAVRLVAAMVGEQGLSGLVNNAGIPYGGPVEFLELDRVRRTFEVNFFGLIAATQAFLPLLRRGRGRIVNMSSISGMVASPFVSPYSCSKFAMEALSDSLRVELHPWNIGVSVVEPGAIDTPIWDKAGEVARGIVTDAPQAGLDLYGSAIHDMQATFVRHGISTDPVARAVEHALTSRRPRTRYPIALEGAIVSVFRWLPDRLRDRFMLARLPKWG